MYSDFFFYPGKHKRTFFSRKFPDFLLLLSISYEFVKTGTLFSSLEENLILNRPHEY